MPKGKSDVIKLLDLVYANANVSTAHSWERVNHAMRIAVELAIGSGFEWSAGDMRHLVLNYNSGHWLGDSTEWIYRLAIEVGNTSAIASYEKHYGRTGIIADDVSIGERRIAYLHGVGDRKSERLAVGFSFPWKGVVVRVTSFKNAEQAVVACSYTKERIEGSEYEREKLAKRFTITREDIIADRAERKERTALVDKIVAAVSSRAITVGDVKIALGCTSNVEVAALPIGKLREYVRTLGRLERWHEVRRRAFLKACEQDYPTLTLDAVGASVDRCAANQPDRKNVIDVLILGEMETEEAIAAKPKRKGKG